MGGWPTWREEKLGLAQGHRHIAGIDEVGRGPLAGPLVAAAIILPLQPDASWTKGIRDSKLLSPEARRRLHARLCQVAISHGIGIVGPDQVDSLGIVEATRRAMVHAVRQLDPRPDLLLIDAMPLPQAGLPHKAIVHGDALCVSIAAASIVAKVTRDQLMQEMDRAYPGYGFAQHKGYPTPAHLQQLRRLGPSPLHRRSFGPVRRLLEGVHA
ncbi:MAG: ribonuclease HII [Chloroflexi bacterium]|nr:ribonuclease HII [Chloroflexota bacterium]